MTTDPESVSQTVGFCDMQWHVDFVTFWDRVRALKLHVWKRDEPRVATCGSITIDLQPCERSTPANAVFYSDASVAVEAPPYPNEPHPDGMPEERIATIACDVPGTLINFNHEVTLGKRDSKHVLQEAIWDQLIGPLLRSSSSSQEDGAVGAEEAWRCAPYLFSVMHTFADLKAYTYHHHEAFPSAILRGARWHVQQRIATSSEHDDNDDDSAPFLNRICDALSERIRRDPAHPFAPLLCRRRNTVTSVAIEPFTPQRWWQKRHVAPDSSGTSQCVVAFYDVSTESSCLGWPAMNFLTCLRLACPEMHDITLLAVRQGTPGKSLYLTVTCDPLSDASKANIDGLVQAASLTAGTTPVDAMASLFAVTGWHSKKPIIYNMSRERDPARRANEDSSFNLHLMSWQPQRVVPELERLAACKALLLGAGTLGCHVARNLLCWGVRHITLVDRGRVSFSNLARQSLFSLEDATEHRPKALAAADALNHIIPSPRVTGVDLTIHMPGHRLDNGAETQAAEAEVERLAALVQSHDVVFMLTDSREARWLPTVLAAAHGVPVINVALGFSEFDVQRHGVVRPDKSSSNAVGAMHETAAAVKAQASGMGCYFCRTADPIVDSMSHRTLDRQCSVTRPGVSAMASAIACELLASLYQHPNGFLCPHTTDVRCTALGALPQMLSGEVNGYTVRSVACDRGDFCEACAEPVLRGYEADGTAFVMQCLRDPDYLDTVCGMKAQRQSHVRHTTAAAHLLVTEATTGANDDLDLDFVEI